MIALLIIWRAAEALRHKALVASFTPFVDRHSIMYINGPVVIDGVPNICGC